MSVMLQNFHSKKAAQVRPGVVAGRTGELGQVGGDSSVELIDCRPGVGGNGDKFMLDHSPTVRRIRAAANVSDVPKHHVRQSAADTAERPGLTVTYPTVGVWRKLRGYWRR
jgi:hypothetical protein